MRLNHVHGQMLLSKIGIHVILNQKFVRFNTMCVCTVKFARSEISAHSWVFKNNILVLRFKHPFMIVSHAMTSINWTLGIGNLVWITCLLNLRRLGILQYSNFVDPCSGHNLNKLFQISCCILGSLITK